VTGARAAWAAAQSGGDGCGGGGGAAAAAAAVGDDGGVDGAVGAAVDGGVSGVGAAGSCQGRRRPRTAAVGARRRRRTHCRHPRPLDADADDVADLHDRPPGRRRRLRRPSGPVRPSTWCPGSEQATCFSDS